MKSLFTRTGINNTIAVGGVVVILLQTLFIAETRLQVSVIVFGILLNQLGVWQLATRILPDRRKYLRLRAEVDHFLGLVRLLNSQKVAGATGDVSHTRTRMLESVDQMMNVAGEVGEAPDEAEEAEEPAEMASDAPATDRS